MTRLRRYAAWTTLATLCVFVTGCGSGDDTKATKHPSPSVSASATPSAGASPTDTSTLSQDQLMGKLVANAPPKNLTWLVPDPPSEWTRLNTEKGTLQWRLGSEPCLITLGQPAGVGSAKSPTSQQVLERNIRLVRQSMKATSAPKITAHDPVTVANHVVGLDGSSATSFAHAQVDFGGGAQADIRAYRAGDFALTAIAACGKGRFADVFTSDMEPFLDKLSAKTAY